MTYPTPVGHRGLTTGELLGCLRALHCTSPIVVANKRDFLNLYTESDFVAATMAGQVYEYEIKVSRRDFLKDRLKLRNRIYTGEAPGLRPNRFWYVTPDAILTAEDIPSFAGWLVLRNGVLEQVRRAPLLHRDCHGVTVLMRLARAMRERSRGKGQG